MHRIDTTLIEGYENMNAEEKLAALEAFEYDDYSSEVQRYKNAATKANGEAASWKKKHNELLSQDELAKQQNAETLEDMKNELETLRKEKTVSGYKANGSNHAALQSGMKSYHVKSRGFSDIAQHFTIFPDGKVMTGRSLDRAAAGIIGCNAGGICIECLGNFDKGGDTMTAAQKAAIAETVKIMLDRFHLTADNVTYHAWWTAKGRQLGDYVKGKSAKTCPGTNFFGGNTRAAYEKNLRPMIESKGENILKKVESINDIVWELTNAGIITDGKLWVQKCAEDKNVYWLCYKMANKLRETL